MLEDESKIGFKLVIDGYLQNEQPLNKLNLQKLSLGQHDLVFLMADGEKLRRKIDLDLSSHYQYVLHRNFMGERKLRFRGSHAKLSQSAMVLDFNTKTEYHDITENIAAVDSLSHYIKVEESKPVKTIAKARTTKDSTKEKVIAAVSAIKTDTEVKTDTLSRLIAAVDEPTETKDSAATVKPIKVIDRQANTFSALQKSISLNNFEFDKIQMIEEFLQAEKISASQLVNLLKELKYDQSRLQILKTVASKQADLKMEKDQLLATLDYELSRQKANTFFP